MTSEEILTALAVPEGFPRDAMIAAGDHRDTMVPAFLDLVHRLTRARPEAPADDDVAAFLFAFYLLGEWRETQAYRPLTRLLRRESDFLDLLLGDAITEGTSRVIAGVFDGDLAPILEVIEDPRADMFVRIQMIDALVFIARDRPQAAPEVKRYLEHFHRAAFEKPDLLWEAWGFAVAVLGLEELEPAVVQLYTDGVIPHQASRVEDFRRALREAVETGRSSRFDRSRRPMRIESAVDELSGWYCFSEAYAAERARAQSSGSALPQFLDETFERAVPKIGRNDPCPCGSGKKFKKCCLH